MKELIGHNILSHELNLLTVLKFCLKRREMCMQINERERKREREREREGDRERKRER